MPAARPQESRRTRFNGSRAQARQLVAHGHITVNGRRTDVASFLLRPGDVVRVKGRKKSIDAVMCIIAPDGLMLTAGGKVGTGAEGSVKGAKILLTTKTASRVIADVYAVRKDYLDANRDKVQRFVHALMKGQEQLQDL